MRHFVYEATLYAPSWLAAYEFVLLYVLHEVLSIEKLHIIAELGGFTSI